MKPAAVMLIICGLVAGAADEFAERVRARVASTQVQHADASFSLSISMGVATLDESETLESAIGRADAALYAIKSQRKTHRKAG